MPHDERCWLDSNQVAKGVFVVISSEPLYSGMGTYHGQNRLIHSTTKSKRPRSPPLQRKLRWGSRRTQCRTQSESATSQRAESHRSAALLLRPAIAGLPRLATCRPGTAGLQRHQTAGCLATCRPGIGHSLTLGSEARLTQKLVRRRKLIRRWTGRRASRLGRRRRSMSRSRGPSRSRKTPECGKDKRCVQNDLIWLARLTPRASERLMADVRLVVEVSERAADNVAEPWRRVFELLEN